MKLNKTNFLVLVIIVALASHGLYAQSVHEITLNVDTKNPDPAKTCYFKVGKTTSVLNNTPANFTIFAQVGDNIKWKGVSSTESNTPVRIRAIKYISGPRIFSSDVIKGGESAEATVIRGGKTPYKYQLQFSVGSNTSMYTMEPKIQIGEQ
ncbi:MAG: hypothetical protein KJO53_13485 [Eudoraea sp.]|nr:hypothetical protein [Eudoraea sp.]MBT8293317.1 hypothetical protein [Eudoraea sp.]NNL01057.1 hypothetical protein [Eudoraea sp.]